MRETTVQPGLYTEFQFVVSPDKVVPYLYPESPEFQTMPEVFATGFMVELIEWTCIQALKPHLGWPNEQSVGTHVDLGHTASAPSGMTVTDRKLTFAMEADDEVEPICRGAHQRFVIEATRFNAKLMQKTTAQ
ncbi:MAG: thioesterase [Candidatus Contendobacter odensis]|uniref:Thioesterase n=1 Tax=Candidatus Contendibacter odensensis TaxID=1400860 RepID=A0A2G6PFH7_9GAMM|nr:MAG: thioesterase [Candidatus Contendobacter odensis]